MAEGRGSGGSVVAFLDDAALAISSWFDAAPRAWATVALGVALASASLGPQWLAVTAVVAGCLVARALPFPVPAPAVLVAAFAAVLTFASDTIPPDVRKVLDVVAAPLAAGVTAAWAAARRRPLFPWVSGAVLAGALAATIAARVVGREGDPAWAAAVPAGAAGVALAAGTRLRWVACAGYAAILLVAHPTTWASAPFSLIQEAGAALTVAFAATSARDRDAGVPCAADAAWARCVTAVRRRPLMSALLVAVVLVVAEPLQSWSMDLHLELWTWVMRFGHSLELTPPPFPWSAGWYVLPLLAVHLASLDGLASAIRRASVVAAASACIDAGWQAVRVIDAGSPASLTPGWAWEQALAASAGAMAMITFAVYSWGTARRPPGSAIDGWDGVALALLVAALGVPFVVEPATWTQQIVPEVLLAIAVHRLAMTRTSVGALLVGAAATVCAVVLAAAVQWTDARWLLPVAFQSSAVLLRLILYVAILRRLRSMTPVPDDHPILADYATDLRLRPEAAGS